jgi:hypothetical protein
MIVSLVKAAIDETLDDWGFVVPMDWSGRFGGKMIEEFPRFVVEFYDEGNNIDFTILNGTDECWKCSLIFD